MAFRDVLEITVQGGKGGDGAMSFLRLKYVEKGGPDGGHGGHGGSVWLEAVDNVTSLDNLVNKRSYRGGTGMQGEGRERAGAAGDDVIVTVPVGTLAIDADTGGVVADLVEVGERVMVAAGGLGGRGNASFASARRQAPRFAERGTPGERRRLRLELRTIADVGLVGYPNAGKSSLLAALSNARPKVAEYPFTTLSPNLGVIERGGAAGPERITMADIPGIIEDAHLGKGLGLDFLRHITRTRLLLYVLDIAEAPADTLAALQHELAAYDAGLLERPALAALNKTDLAAPSEVEAAVDALAAAGLPLVPVSALERAGLDDLVDALFSLLPPAPKPIAAAAERRVVGADPTRVERDMSGSGWVVRGRDLEAVVARFDASNPDAVSYLQHHFASLGVNKLLKRAGAATGDDVQIGGAVFEYFDEEAAEAETRAAARAEKAERAAAERRYLADTDADGAADTDDGADAHAADADADTGSQAHEAGAAGAAGAAGTDEAPGADDAAGAERDGAPAERPI
jgi:GTPase